jgi:hypothetical protein
MRGIDVVLTGNARGAAAPRRLRGAFRNAEDSSNRLDFEAGEG